MARYSLIFRDDTYFKLMDRCKQEQKSMGRMLNDIIEGVVNSWDETEVNLKNKVFAKVQCYFPECQGMALTTIQNVKTEKTFFVCDRHKPEFVRSKKWVVKA